MQIGEELKVERTKMNVFKKSTFIIFIARSCREIFIFNSLHHGSV